MDGPTGVKNATQKIREVLQTENPKYFIRADIKSFYKSIPHYKLIQDIKKYYDDPKLIKMLENIIKNPIDSPYGYKNPDNGIALGIIMNSPRRILKRGGIQLPPIWQQYYFNRALLYYAMTHCRLRLLSHSRRNKF